MSYTAWKRSSQEPPCLRSVVADFVQASHSPISKGLSRQGGAKDPEGETGDNLRVRTKTKFG